MNDNQNRKIRALVLIFLISLLALTLRIFYLTKVPGGFYNDETLVGYEAYSILKTGRDQYGTSWPIAFKAFGDYRPGLYIYSIVPSVAIFGLNEFAVRFPSVLYSVLLIIVTYFLSQELFRNNRLSLFASLWLSIVPFSVQYGRIAHDTNLATLLMSLGVLLYLRAKKNNYFLPISAVVFAISLYVYYTTKVVVPLLVLFFLIKDFKWFRKNTKITIISLLLSILIILPIIFSLIYSPEKFFSRSNQISLWGDKGLIANILQGHQEDTYTLISSVGRIYHNKVVDGFIMVIKSLLNHINMDFLVLYGDADNLYKIPSFGVVYLLDLILIVVGLMCLYKYKTVRSIIIFWLIVGLIPDTLTRLSPTSSRIHFILPALAIIVALAVNFISNHLSVSRKLLNTYLAINGWYLFIFSFFLHQYFNHLPVRYAREWHYGLKELVSEIKNRQDIYDKIWISKTLWGWINVAFFLKYPPSDIQKEIVLTDINEFGLGWVYSFDKYYFDVFPLQMTNNENILFVGEPVEFPEGTVPDKIIYYPDNTPAYYIVPGVNISSESL